MKKIYIQAENFRDKAWGVAKIDDRTELVLEMTHGYSDLYFRDAVTREVITEELFFEEPDHKKINEYCMANYGIEFISSMI